MGKEDREILPERRFHEESLLAQRLMIFLLFNSILFLGFVGLLNLDYLWLKRIVPFAGVVSCGVLIFNSWGVKKELDWLDQKEGRKKETGINKLCKGRIVGFWIAVVFLLLVWLPSLLSVFGVIG